MPHDDTRRLVVPEIIHPGSEPPVTAVASLQVPVKFALPALMLDVILSAEIFRFVFLSKTLGVIEAEFGQPLLERVLEIDAPLTSHGDIVIAHDQQSIVDLLHIIEIRATRGLDCFGMQFDLTAQIHARPAFDLVEGFGT